MHLQEQATDGHQPLFQSPRSGQEAGQVHCPDCVIESNQWSGVVQSELRTGGKIYGEETKMVAQVHQGVRREVQPQLGEVSDCPAEEVQEGEMI